LSGEGCDVSILMRGGMKRKRSFWQGVARKKRRCLFLIRERGEKKGAFLIETEARPAFDAEEGGGKTSMVGNSPLCLRKGRGDRGRPKKEKDCGRSCSSRQGEKEEKRRGVSFLIWGGHPSASRKVGRDS